MRLAEIDRSKGLAIFLVVLGHFASSQTTHYVPNWYRVFHDLIYSFHMPFFMFISGVVVSYSSPNLSSVRDWGRFVSKKFWRLMPAFFLFGLLIFLGKTALQQILYVDNPVYQPISILSMLILPYQGHATSLWYIYVLFEICCIYPVLMWVFRQRIVYLLVLALLMQMVGIYAHVPDLFGLDMLCQMFLFFVLRHSFIARLYHDSFNCYGHSCHPRMPWYFTAMEKSHTECIGTVLFSYLFNAHDIYRFNERRRTSLCCLVRANVFRALCSMLY
jgi:fucose 4-O-acetylase-like acetyltransferase